MIIICKDINSLVFVVAYLSFHSGYVTYRLLRQMVQPAIAIVGKLNNNSVSKNKGKRAAIIHQESSDLELSEWSRHIPMEIMELIMQRLPLNDYLRFGKVCSYWRSSLAKLTAEERCPPALEIPLLMFGAHPYTNRDHCFLSLSNNRVVYADKFPGLRWRRCCGCVGGWLIMSDSIEWRPEGFFDFFKPSGFQYVKNFFFNPVLGARIMLPSQTTIPFGCVYELNIIKKVVTSALPTSPICVAAAVSLKGDLVFCRPADKKWTPYENKEMLKFSDALFHEGLLYAITLRAPFFIIVFDLREFTQGCRYPMTKKLVMLPPWPDAIVNSRVVGNTRYSRNCSLFHLVKDHASNDILMIIRVYDATIDIESFLNHFVPNYRVPPRVKSFKVFKLDESGPRWVEINSVGDRIVFVSSIECLILSAATIREHNKELSLEGNCIYFAYDFSSTRSPQQGRDVGVFYLADGSIKRNLPYVPRSWLTSRTVWFMPKPW